MIRLALLLPLFFVGAADEEKEYTLTTKRSRCTSATTSSW